MLYPYLKKNFGIGLNQELPILPEFQDEPEAVNQITTDAQLVEVCRTNPEMERHIIRKLKRFKGDKIKALMYLTGFVQGLSNGGFKGSNSLWIQIYHM